MQNIRVIVADTETSGLNKEDGPCEVAWVEIDEDMNVIDRVHSLIDPQVPIKASASGIHSITDRIVAEAPTLDEFFDEVLGNPFQNDQIVFVAHNAPFDWKFFKKYIPNHLGTICTLRLARHIFPDEENHKLQTLRYSLGLEDGEGGGAHTAMGDVEVCLNLLRAAVNKDGGTLMEMMEISETPITVKTMPFGKHKGTKLGALPTQYVQWLLGLDNIDDDLRGSLEQL